MNQVQSIKLDLAIQHVDILVRSAMKQPYESVAETIQLVQQQANNGSLQNPAPAPTSYVEAEIRRAIIETLGGYANKVHTDSQFVDAVVIALDGGRVDTGTPPTTHIPV